MMHQSRELGPLHAYVRQDFSLGNLGANNTEAKVAVPSVRDAAGAERNARLDCTRAITAAPIRHERVGASTDWVYNRLGRVVTSLVLTPFRNIAAQIVEAKLVWLLGGHRVGLIVV